MGGKVSDEIDYKLNGFEQRKLFIVEKNIADFIKISQKQQSDKEQASIKLKNNAVFSPFIYIKRGIFCVEIISLIR